MANANPTTKGETMTTRAIDSVLVSTDSLTGERSVFRDWDEVRRLYADLGWNGDPAEHGIMSIRDYIEQQVACGSNWEADDYAADLRSREGDALDGIDEGDLLHAIERILS